MIVRARRRAAISSTTARRCGIPFPPLDATLDWRPSWRLLLVASRSAVVAVAWAPRVRRPVLGGATLLVGSTALGAAWAVALALLDGAQGLVGSVTLKNEYLVDVGRVVSPVTFLARFRRPHRDVPRPRAGPSARVPARPVGSRRRRPRHPSVGGDARDRRRRRSRSRRCCSRCARSPARRRTRAAAPFVAVAPVAIWVATSADALLRGGRRLGGRAGRAGDRRRDRRSDGLAIAGGRAVRGHRVPLVRARAPRDRPVVVACAADAASGRSCVAGVGAPSVFVAFAARGFWWFDGSRRDAGAVLRRSRVASSVRRVPARRPRVLRDRDSVPRSRSRSPDCAIGALWSWSARARRRRRRRRSAACRRARSSASGCRSRCGCSRPAAVLASPRPHRAVARAAGGVHDRPADPGAQPVVILVTGGAGFIGSFVVDQLVDHGHDVRVLDRLHPSAHAAYPTT